MKKYFNIIVILFFCFSCDENKTEELTEQQRLNKKNPIGFYGKKILLNHYTKINEILNNPNNYIEKEVLVSGLIVDVCPMRGCWIDIREKNSDKVIKIKVKDGNIVFPISAKNYNVKVQGVVTKIVYSEEQAINWKIHLAEEQGIKLDRDSIKIVESDLLEYRINSEGAEIF